MVHKKPLDPVEVAVRWAAVIVISVGSVGCSSGTTSSTTTPPETAVITYQPWQSDGTLKSSIKIKTTASGSCFTLSFASGRSDSYRCSAGNEILDPCFLGPADQVACPIGKPDEPVELIKLSEPAVPNEATGSGSLWLIELSDGAICSPYFGTPTIPVAGLYPTYGCDNGADILDVIDTSASLWTVKLNSPESASLVTSTVARAWN